MDNLKRNQFGAVILEIKAFKQTKKLFSFIYEVYRFS